jgi:hypothetical protein
VVQKYSRSSAERHVRTDEEHKLKASSVVAQSSSFLVNLVPDFSKHVTEQHLNDVERRSASVRHSDVVQKLYSHVLF